MIPEEDRIYLKSVYNRALSIKPLEIIEEKLPQSKVNERAITSEEMNISTGAVKENKLVLKIHNDRWYLHPKKVLFNGSKTLGYKVFKEPLGLITIEVFGGEKVRGQNDLRSENYFRKEQKKYFFVYLEDEEHYQQYKEIKDPESLNPNQQIAFDRIEESEELYKKFNQFVLGFDDYLKAFRREPSNFSESDKIENCLEGYKNFRILVIDFLQIQFIFGNISPVEKDILFKKTNELFKLINFFDNNWRDMKEVDISEFFRTKLSTTAKKLIAPRKIDVAPELNKLKEGVTQKTGQNIVENVEGYLLDGDDFAPSLLEIGRRNDLYDEYQNQDFEDQFIRLLKESIKK